MLTTVFWNVGERVEALDHLPCIAQSLNADVILVAEWSDDLHGVVRKLNRLGTEVFREVANVKSKVRAISRLPLGDISHRFTGLNSDLAIWSIRRPHHEFSEVLIAGVHLVSKAGGQSEADQSAAVSEVVQELNDYEDRVGHRNTVMVGDFNMNPYDHGMTTVTGVHALMTRALAGRPDRTFRKKKRRRFYNPMWGLFGDRTKGAPGSFFWRSSVPHNPHWTLFDQVLLRPPLVDVLCDVEILVNDGVHSLMAPDGAPDRSHLSDHLPLVFQLDI